MASEFEGHHIVVTGGTGALGAAVVGELLGRGATCHVPVFLPLELDAFVHAGHERVHIVEGIDLTDESSTARFFAARPPLWASLQIAGGFAGAELADTSGAEFMRLVRLNALTCFLCCRCAVERIRASDRAGGRLVNVAARPALVPTARMAAYAAAKAAVAALTLSLAEELATEGIWVNAVVPSILDTPANRAAMPRAAHSAWPKVDEVAGTIVHLASPANRVARGALVPVYGRT